MHVKMSTEKSSEHFVLFRVPTLYAIIEDGAWLNDDPYYVIHRIASDGSHKGIGDICLNWCAKQYPSLRADTHKDNIIMQNLLVRNEFIRCGTVYVSNGTPRIAYQKYHDNDRLTAMDAGCNEYLVKPIDRAKLMAVLKNTANI